MTSVDERVQWLTATLDKVAATAKAAVWCGYQLGRSEPTGEWLAPGGPGAASVEDAGGQIVAYDEGAPTEEQAEHIALWDPRSALARVEADRKILEGHSADSHWCPMGDGTIRALLSAYRYHPGFREEWLA